MSFKPALSSCNKVLNEELFENYHKAGIEAIELSYTLDYYNNMDFNKIREMAERFGVKLWSFHLPFMPFDEIDISHPEKCENTIKIFKELIEKANTIGIKVFVIHPSGEPIEENRAERIACAKKSLKELSAFAGELGCVIAVEDLPRSCLGNCSDEISELISADENLRVCFDTNHLLGESITDFIKAVGDKIITTHFSDYDYINERHWLLGEGEINWQELISALEEVGYDGYILYEIDFKAPWSIDRPRDLTCVDFKNNFDELIAKKIPTPIGKPKARLGMWGIEE